MSENVSPGVPSDRDRLRVVAKSVGLALTGAVAGIVTLFVLANFLQALGVNVEQRIILQYGLSILALQGFGFIIVVLAFFAIEDRFDIVSIRMPTLRDAGFAVVGLLGLIGLLALLSALYTTFGVETPSTAIVEDGMQNPQLALYLIPLTYLFVGPGEELMFRGAVQGMIRERYSAVPAIALASGVFALAHTMNVFGAPLGQVGAYLFVIFTLSVLLGTLYEVTGNLLVTIFVHGTYNSVTFLALYFQATGNLPT